MHIYCMCFNLCELISILTTGTPVHHRDPPGVNIQRAEGEEDLRDGERFAGEESREGKKEK